MPAIISRPLPEVSLLRRYQAEGAYVDCLTLDLAGEVVLGQFVEAFYTSLAFRPELTILGLVLGMHSNDADAAALGRGDTTRFAAWHVEARDEAQLLLCDFQRRTRSWLMVAPIPGSSGHSATTRLHFGSAVTLIDHGRIRQRTSQAAFWLLLGFHKLYAWLLLRGAVRRLGVR